MEMPVTHLLPNSLPTAAGASSEGPTKLLRRLSTSRQSADAATVANRAILGYPAVTVSQIERKNLQAYVITLGQTGTLHWLLCSCSIGWEPVSSQRDTCPLQRSRMPSQIRQVSAAAPSRHCPCCRCPWNPSRQPPQAHHCGHRPLNPSRQPPQAHHCGRRHAASSQRTAMEEPVLPEPLPPSRLPW